MFKSRFCIGKNAIFWHILFLIYYQSRSYSKKSWSIKRILSVYVLFCPHDPTTSGTGAVTKDITDTARHQTAEQWNIHHQLKKTQRSPKLPGSYSMKMGHLTRCLMTCSRGHCVSIPNAYPGQWQFPGIVRLTYLHQLLWVFYPGSGECVVCSRAPWNAGTVVSEATGYHHFLLSTTLPSVLMPAMCQTLGHRPQQNTTNELIRQLPFSFPFLNFEIRSPGSHN